MPDLGPAASENHMVTLASYAAGVPEPEHFAISTGAVPRPADGQILCRTLLLSLDPYVRVSLLPPDTHVPRLTPSLSLGSVVPGRGISEVVESRVDGFEAGDIVAGETGWQSYSLSTGADLRSVSAITPRSAALGVLGMPGFTAWSGLRFIGQPKAGDTVAVSAASGAVGSLVVQLAKRAGCRVLGIAGSAEKCAWVERELGADWCISHRTPTLRDDMAATGARIDVYFDNVGGDVLAALLPHMNSSGRVIVCGRISHLNEVPDTAGTDRMPEFLGTILSRQLIVRGFGWTQFADHWDEFEAEVAPQVARGEIKFREEVVAGLEQIPVSFARLFVGDNFGKLLVRVGADPA